MAYSNVCAEIELLKVKVPPICLGTEGVSPRRERRYWNNAKDSLRFQAWRSICKLLMFPCKRGA